jgi:O-antigen/teichoic acid export membrane protein
MMLSLLPSSARLWIHRLSSKQGLFGRALQGSAVISMAYAASSALRLASNLVLARMLFPDAFGLMALVTVVMTGLQMLSDVGTNLSIAHHARGDDPRFLDTAYSINVARGVILWLAACALAYPISRFYDAPQLVQLLPVAALGILATGFTPTRVETAARHLKLVRLTVLDLASNVIGVVAMITLALLTGSVWALVCGQLVGNGSRLVLMMTLMPGRKSRFAWDRTAASDLVGYGKWIFLSTLCAFLLIQGDKLILGAFLSLTEMGLYNIGFFLASFPVLMALAVTGKVMIPLFRERPEPGPALDQHMRKLRRMRMGLTGGVLGLLGLMAVFGVAIVEFLYPDAYHPAGPIVVLVACVQMIAALGITHDIPALAAGDSRGQFFVMALRAAVQSAGLMLGVHHAGLVGALAGQAAAAIVLHCALILLARKHKAWDPVHDGVYIGFIAAVAAAAVAWNPLPVGF